MNLKNLKAENPMSLHLKRTRFLPVHLKDPETFPELPEGFWASLFQKLWNQWGDPYWWPGESAWEVAVGAILTQNTAWTNVEKAIAALKSAQCFTPRAFLESPQETIAETIRPSGYYNMKAKKLVALANWWLVWKETGKINALDDEQLRNELLNLYGAGPETADAIACYAFGRPIFVVDAYTRRTVMRLRGMEAQPSYNDIQQEIHNELPADTILLNHLHGLIVVLGKEHCTARNPKCVGCPLQSSCDYGRSVS